ncbi:PLDc N-terminal domain-containing protein [Aridibaculum aurantiacum]|uniref:PLDc N-terminal domain-containing protein n=1 Tax=Aridibaculum aurantiacum TaxID=2810307 RepID=UPI001A95E6CE
MELLLPEVGLIIWMLLALAILVLPIFALVHLIKTNFRDRTTKLIWVLIIVFVPVAGSIIYFVFDRKQKVIVD